MVTVLVLAFAVLIARITFVYLGILYGSTQVSRVDGIIASLIIGVIAAIIARTAPSSGTSLVDRAAVLTAIAGAVVLLVSGVNLFFPAEKVGLAKPSCSGSRTLKVKYIGITAGEVGNNSRSGPARYYPANGRFAADCSLGFSEYCIGDPILDKLGSDDSQRWFTSRWLRVAKQPPGWKAFLAKHLSGETKEPQFVSDAYVTPETNYEDLPLSSDCPSAFRPPSRAELKDFDPANQTLTATADHSVNIGFAVWLPPGQGFREPNSYLPVYDGSLPATANPGALSSKRGNTKSVTWTYRDSLLPKLSTRRPGGAKAKAEVVVMAIPCISDNLPAKISTAAVRTFDIAGGKNPIQQSKPLRGYNAQTLARAACQANT
ncbi:hypothetical protein [Streptomyces sp. NPDC088794]|uniref:hypothetical protein n=1 Tax=Streptomyces sp. NPDC088794 TaxID=3365902 RepID=UPI00380755BC